jgi:AmmeMemoRadiSam system protein B
MCGYLPAAHYACSIQIAGRNSTTCKYMTSGEISGDFENVVGYAGIILTRK